MLNARKCVLGKEVLRVSGTVAMPARGRSMPDRSLGRVAYLLILLGGVIIMVFGLASLIGTTIANFSLLSGFGLQYGIIQIILGVVALVGAKKAGQIEWAIILIVIGLIAGGVGGILVLLGAIVSLILKYA